MMAFRWVRRGLFPRSWPVFVHPALLLGGGEGFSFLRFFPLAQFFSRVPSMRLSNSPGPWTVDCRKTESPIDGHKEIFYFVILDANGRVIMDTLNSEVACIEDEFDEYGSRAWDEQGRIDCELVITLFELHQVICKGQV